MCSVRQELWNIFPYTRGRALSGKLNTLPAFYVLPKSPGDEPEPGRSMCSLTPYVCTRPLLPCAGQPKIILSHSLPTLPVPILSHAQVAISVDHVEQCVGDLHVTRLCLYSSSQGRFFMLVSILKSCSAQAKSSQKQGKILIYPIQNKQHSRRGL